MSIKKLNLNDIKKGSLVDEVRERNVEFVHNGDHYNVDIKIKTLPYIETQSLFSRWDLGRGEDVAAEWISKALVNDKGELEFTKEEVEENFVQPMVNVIFEQIWGTDNIKKLRELSEEKAKEMQKDISQAKEKSSTN